MFLLSHLTMTSPEEGNVLCLSLNDLLMTLIMRATVFFFFGSHVLTSTSDGARTGPGRDRDGPACVSDEEIVCT